MHYISYLTNKSYSDFTKCPCDVLFSPTPCLGIAFTCYVLISGTTPESFYFMTLTFLKRLICLSHDETQLMDLFFRNSTEDMSSYQCLIEKTCCQLVPVKGSVHWFSLMQSHYLSFVINGSLVRRYLRLWKYPMMGHP